MINKIEKLIKVYCNILFNTLYYTILQYTFINFLVIAPACFLFDITTYVRFRNDFNGLNTKIIRAQSREIH